ncbi:MULTISPECIES: DNA-3-methyladenine glycosylase I [Methylobacterium]|uniref:DNA-3-methyladenine glycosylase 1 n=2 Tax=Pseudomonadota TaxID=1224 RepID=A0ABQ4SW79_9HYPH|nr:MULTISPECIES: DNA-3-methyladenine glycosylase I [Methylobacterium]PIU07781.1 MAG: DNA-3-methyladenine glycosylase I [Methylobacterium sp. CG09_land_8_20_14_0_10_71_15]PIU11287.1 MAG: DNA-3-methyladenine glycosylase I [Methylobacterium sp. CG08_land_8_20_14_0_20_71_15]GJE06760.1 DNA-3-methyladenine glycosylase 1 [Methylobacterium jeotgali]
MAPEPQTTGLVHHPDGCARCWWAGLDPLYVAYHDTEWGVPEYDSRALYEKLILDGFQAGLSWITILRRREGFRSAFAGFDPERIARFTEADIERLMADTGIIRNRAKIVGAVNGARAFLRIEESGPGFSRFLWDLAGGAPAQPRPQSRADIPTETEVSRAMGRALKAEGFSFCGPTIVYAFMQAVGMVNDHLAGCHRHAPCAALAKPAP